MSLKMKSKKWNKSPADYKPGGLAEPVEPEEKLFINDRPIGTPVVSREKSPMPVLSGGKVDIAVTLGILPVPTQKEKLL
jgi:hypothetical protein